MAGAGLMGGGGPCTGGGGTQVPAPSQDPTEQGVPGSSGTNSQVLWSTLQTTELHSGGLGGRRPQVVKPEVKAFALVAVRRSVSLPQLHARAPESAITITAARPFVLVPFPGGERLPAGRD